MALDTTRSKYMCVTYVTLSQISIAIRPAVFESQVILKQVYGMTPNDIEHYMVTGTPICSADTP